MNGKNRRTVSPDLERSNAEDKTGDNPERRRDTRNVRQIQSASVLHHGEEIKEGRFMLVVHRAYSGAAGSILSMTVEMRVDPCVFMIGGGMDVAERREG